MRRRYYHRPLYTLEALKEGERRFGLVKASGCKNLTRGNEHKVDGVTYVMGDSKEGEFLIKTPSFEDLYKEEGVVVLVEKVNGFTTNLNEEDLLKVLATIKELS